MAYTKDYYHILQLPAPGWTSKQQTTSADLRRAYKVALLAAHPDKASAVAATPKTKAAYTVDDVKEAYATLANATTKSEYDGWFLRHGDSLAPTAMMNVHGHRNTDTNVHTNTQPSSDFILGLELLDLGDFDVWDGDGDMSLGTNPPARKEGEGGEEQQQTTWTRACRCGADKGFRILEQELEDAEARGQKEVLVGCVGCSLWVRVGFEVEVD
jgi:diphthamide biosynthesis protein 4